MPDDEKKRARRAKQGLTEEQVRKRGKVRFVAGVGEARALLLLLAEEGHLLSIHGAW